MEAKRNQPAGANNESTEQNRWPEHEANSSELNKTHHKEPAKTLNGYVAKESDDEHIIAVWHEQLRRSRR